MRAWCWRHALEWLDSGGMLPTGELGDQLLAELCLPEYKFQAGKLVIESKEEITARNQSRSPDLADTFVMLCAPPPSAIMRTYSHRYGLAQKTRTRDKRFGGLMGYVAGRAWNGRRPR